MKTAQNVVLIKLGGSIITDKTIPNSVRYETLRQLIREIKQARAKISDLIILGHGAGSFAHVPASNYKTAEGFINDESKLGMAITQDSAAQLNRIVVQECLKQDLPAVSVYVSNSVVLRNGKVANFYDSVFREYLKKGLLPVTTGDVLVDEVKGCGIWSADKILPFFAEQFAKNGWNVKRIIHVTSTPGVYKNMNQLDLGTFDVITRKNQEEVRSSIGATRGFDVTGGMWKKIEEALELADQGIETVIHSTGKGELLRSLTGGEIAGTVIQP